MAKIHDREATIKTATVEIKALTVAGRQVTQALFRQLEAEPLIDFASMTLVGVPWGRVNYHVGCNEYTGDHMHVVWQKGEELRRDCVRLSQGAREIDERVGRAEPWVLTALLGGMLEEEPYLGELRVTELPKEGYSASGTLFVGTAQYRAAPSELVRALFCYWNGGWVPTYLEGETYSDEFRARTKAASLESSRGDIIRLMREQGARSDWEKWAPVESMEMATSVKRQREQMQSGWDALWTSLCHLDQLFIAV